LEITNISEQYPRLETKVRGVKIQIDTSLINSVTGILVSSALWIPFPKTTAQPFRDKLKACFKEVCLG
jgi:hypothetical protein